MQNEQKSRLEKFKKVSGYLLPLTSLAMVLMAAAALVAIAIVLCKPVGQTPISAAADVLTLGTNIDGYNNIADWFLEKRLDWPAKLLIASMFSIVSYFAVRAMFHFNRLLEYFYEGEIFNQKALTHGRNAFRLNLFSNLCFIAAYLVLLMISIASSHPQLGSRIEHFFEVALGLAIDFGFYCLILWALEMGTDLSEDAELTI